MTLAAVRRWRRVLALALLAPLAAACEIAPEPVHVDAEECVHCSMLISDRRFATQLLNTRGKAYKFDSIECLRAFVLAGTVAAEDTHSIWVTDLDAGTGWIAAGEAAFLRSPELRSPMGGGLAAYASVAAAEAAAAQLNGVVMTWDELLATAPAGAGHEMRDGGHDSPPDGAPDGDDTGVPEDHVGHESHEGHGS